METILKLMSAHSYDGLCKFIKFILELDFSKSHVTLLENVCPSVRVLFDKAYDMPGIP